MMISNMASGQMSISLGAKGPNINVVTACATGTHSIGDSFKLIANGDADAMICGGAEATIRPTGLAGFCAMRAMSTRNDDPAKASRPFDTGRDGFVMGEGAGILILESLEHAQARGARIYGEVIGYGLTGDAHHMTEPDPDGAARCMTMALRNAGIKPEEVDYINAHGTSAAGWRSFGNARNQKSVWRSCVQARRKLYQIHDRSYAWRCGWCRSGNLRIVSDTSDTGSND